MRYMIQKFRFDKEDDRIRETEGNDRIVAVLSTHDALNGIYYVYALVELSP
jgi:hypothetical protein